MNILGYIDTILQGAIQGFTEFLPISSSGHLSVFQHFTGVSSKSSLLLSILLHLATLGATVIAFRSTVWELIVELFSLLADIFTLKIFKKQDNRPNRRALYMLMLSCVPLFLILPFKDKVELLSINTSVIEEGVFFIITSLILTFADLCVKGRKTLGEVTVRDSLGIGFGQLIAILPGISRSGTTISAGLLTGLCRKDAVRYSFILGMPTILAAALLQIKDFFMLDTAAELDIMPAIAGMIVALITGLIAIRLVEYIVKSNKFKIFAIYTFILGICVIALGVYELIFDTRIIFNI